MKPLKAFCLMISVGLIIYGLVMFGIYFPILSVCIGISLIFVLGGYEIYKVFYEIVNGSED